MFVTASSKYSEAFRKQAELELRRFTREWSQKDDRLAATSYFGSFAFYLFSLWLTVQAWPNPVLVVPLVVINGFAGIRLYVLQHDAGHASLFSKRSWNDLAGYGLSVFTLTPYVTMRHNHNAHHSHLGNLEERHTTEIHTMTLAEWTAANGWTRLAYRLYRNPLLMIPLGGLFTYVIVYRWPHNAAKIDPWGVIAHNLALAGWVYTIYLLAGLPGLIIYGGTVLVAACAGVFLVYLQHNFEDTWWNRKPDLNPARAALQGSSALDLGVLWDLGTANIAYHDIHHFNANVPSYRLRKCHRALREKYEVQTIGWGEAFRSFSLKLWDEDQERLVPFPKRQETAALSLAE